MEPYDLLEVGHHPVKEEWRSVTTTSGALSVMTHGTVWMLTLPVCILVIALKVGLNSVISKRLLLSMFQCYCLYI